MVRPCLAAEFLRSLLGRIQSCCDRRPQAALELRSAWTGEGARPYTI
jgi:hypothetical protein